jgi:predicted aspartyl protease
MSFLKVKVRIYNPAKPDEIVEVDALVDTVAIYSVIRRDLLERLDVRPLERRRFRSLGGYVERDVGEVGMMLLGRRRVAPVIFGEKDDMMIIGVSSRDLWFRS